jgi:hypothetical protein
MFWFVLLQFTSQSVGHSNRLFGAYFSTRISASAPSHPWPRHRIRARLGNPQSWSRCSCDQNFQLDTCNFQNSWILVSGTFVTALGIIWNQCILPRKVIAISYFPMQLAEKSCRCMPLGPLDVPLTAALAAKGSSKDRREAR